ncbi:S41 family peptidase [Hymenobacter bucti]|uniref:S41 family peptidase n=1 Tax=Hymenobacter bucti TaxID=1844114 RepID=A0ABW4R1K0_9BACT
MTSLRYWLLLVLCLGGSQVTATSVIGRPADLGVPSLPALSKLQLESLVLLGRVWGFVKYYHPAATTGEVDWDHELRTLLPQVTACRTPLERSQVFGQWLTSLGPVLPCPSCAPVQATARLQPTLRWLTDLRVVSPALSAQLTFLRDNRAQEPATSVHLGAAGQVLYNEDVGAPLTYPALSERLLALYRYWNIIEYFFPYKYAIGEPWEQVLAEFIPRFRTATDAPAYHLTVLALITRLHDTHATLFMDPVLEKYWGAYQVPVRLVFIGAQPVVAEVYQVAGPAFPLQRGDVLTQVGGQSVAWWVAAHQALVPASNLASQRRNMAALLLRGDTTHIPVQLRRDGQSVTVTVPQLRIRRGWLRPPSPAPDTTRCYHLVQPDIGYLTLATLEKNQLPTIMQAFRHTKGLIIDLRNYPHEFVVYDLARYFVTEPTPFVRVSAPDLTYPGQFLDKAPLLVRPGGGLPPYQGQVLLLVNEQTQSQAEFTAMALRCAPKARLLGSSTAGADGNVSDEIFLPGGLATRITGLGVYYPDGRETQRIGLVPDIMVSPTPAGLAAGRDELLEQAIQVLNDSH